LKDKEWQGRLEAEEKRYFYLSEQYEDTRIELFELQDKVKTAQAEVERLREESQRHYDEAVRLYSYAKHKDDCNRVMDGGRCTCGLNNSK